MEHVRTKFIAACIGEGHRSLAKVSKIRFGCSHTYLVACLYTVAPRFMATYTRSSTNVDTDDATELMHDLHAKIVTLSRKTN